MVEEMRIPMDRPKRTIRNLQALMMEISENPTTKSESTILEAVYLEGLVWVWSFFIW